VSLIVVADDLTGSVLVTARGRSVVIDDALFCNVVHAATQNCDVTKSTTALAVTRALRDDRVL
jgi:hypothetical protein